MKNTSLVIKSMMVLVSAFCLITWNGSLEAWAKGSGGSHGTNSAITQPGNTQGSPGASSSNKAMDKVVDPLATVSQNQQKGVDKAAAANDSYIRQ